MEAPFHQYSLDLFPVDSQYLVASFWEDVDISGVVGNISYQVYSTGSPLFDTVNTIASDEENINFNGHWMVVAEWNGVSEFLIYMNVFLCFLTLIEDHIV